MSTQVTDHISIPVISKFELRMSFAFYRKITAYFYTIIYIIIIFVC